VGDLAQDTAVRGAGDGRHEATLSADWETWGPMGSFTAPTLDLDVAFHRPTSGEEWLLCDGEAPVSTGGLFGWTARIWSSGGSLHATGGGQCLDRRLPPPSGS
jgi:acyl-CoA thioesterase